MKVLVSLLLLAGFSFTAPSQKLDNEVDQVNNEEVVVVEEQEQEIVIEKSFYDKALEFFNGVKWTSLVGTISSGGLIATLCYLLKKRKGTGLLSVVVGKSNEIVEGLKEKVGALGDGVEAVKTELNGYAEKVNDIITLLSVAISGMNIKEEYKVELQKMVNNLAYMNENQKAIVSSASDLANKIIEDTKNIQTKDVVEVKSELAQAVNELLK